MQHKPISDSFDRGDAYERYIGRWSRKLAPRFLSWMDCPAGLSCLDVGCGTGALAAAIIDHDAPVLVAGMDPSNGFLTLAKNNLAGQALLCQGSAERLPFQSGSFDVAVSGLALNFIPDPRAGMIEMVRVTKAGGSLGAYVWDYAVKMELIRAFWDAAIELDPNAGKLDEALRFPLCNPEPLRELFTTAGLSDVQVEAIDIQTPFASFNEYWQPFLGGQGPGPAYVMSLDEAARGQLRERLRQRLPAQADGSILLIARAWAVRGEVT